MYKLYNEKIETEEKVNGLNSQINTLQDKINKVSEIKANANTTEKENEISKTSNIMTESDALNFGKEKYKEAMNLKPENDTSIVIGATQNSSGWWKVTNIDEIKSKLTDDAFSYFCREFYIEKIEGVYCSPVGNRGVDISLDSSEIQRIDKITDSEIIYIAIARYNDYSTYNNGEAKTTKAHTAENKFILVKENGVWKIQEYVALY